MTTATGIAKPSLGHAGWGDGQEVKRLQPSASLVMVAIFGINLVIITVLFLANEQMRYMFAGAHLLSSIGSYLGFLTCNLMLVQLLLMSRSRQLDAAIGLSRLTKWHRVLGETSFITLVLHVVFIVVGYAATMKLSIAGSVHFLIFEVRDVMMAGVAALLIVAIVLTSIRAARKRIKHETWHFVHLYAYLAVILSLPHQIYSGTHFAKTPWGIAYWSTLYVVVVVAILSSRVYRPLVILVRHDLRVASVVRESQTSVSVYLRGRRLHYLTAESGQYFHWRFLDVQRWWQSHPYSLSSSPETAQLRITVKDLGDGSATLRFVKPGTRVLAEGPFGNMTAARRKHRRVLLIAGGIGVTPIRALAEEFAMQECAMTVIYRAQTEEDLVFADELDTIVTEANGRLQFVTGNRNDFPLNRQPLSPRHLRSLAGDLRDTDVYVCGPAPMIETVLRSLAALEVPVSHVHTERFEIAP